MENIINRTIENIECPKCGAHSTTIQFVAKTQNKKHGIMWWLCIGWWLIFAKIIGWMLFGIFMLIPKLFKKKKIETKISSFAVCQSCGYSWDI